MPSVTFEKLSEEKKKQIEMAAIKEFSNYTYHDISINRIIHDIDMPRGSFYLYFENKEDLYLYIMDKYISKYIEAFIVFLKDNNGDIILSYEYVLDKAINYCNNGEYSMLLTKFLRGLTHRIGMKTPSLQNIELINRVLNNINRDYLNNNCPEDLFVVLDILTNTLIHSLTEYLVMDIPIDRVRAKYFEQLRIIRIGIYKEDLCLN